MSTAARTKAGKLRAKYARAYDVPLEQVVLTELPDDDVTVACPSRPELPVWSTGCLPHIVNMSSPSRRKR